jgi:heptosyltransferase-2
MNVRSLAIRAPNWVGDVVMATPVFAAALADPRFERVRVLIRRPLAKVLEGTVPPDSLVELESSAHELELLRRERPDAVLLLSNSFGAAWRATRAGVPVRAGSALSGRRVLLTHAVVPPTRDGRRAPIPTAHLLRDVAGLLAIHVPSLHPALAASAAERAALRATLAPFGLAPEARYVVCSPGAAFGAAKLWPVERFAAALDALAERRGLAAVVSGGPGEEALMDAVAARTKSGALSLANVPRDLGTLRALVAEASLMLVGDSGPRWFAAAFDVPCVCVMGPNFPELTATSLERARIVRVEGLECSPCVERVCPLGHHRCMTELAVERVVAAAEELLEREPRCSRA